MNRILDPEDATPCGACNLNQFQSRKRLWIRCAICRPGWYHMSCIGLTAASAASIPNWHCERGCSHPTITTSTSNSPILIEQSSPSDQIEIEPKYPGIRVIQRVPKHARHLAAVKLSEVLDRCVEENSLEAWADLFHFAWRRLYQPKQTNRGKSGAHGPGTSLTTKIKDQLNSTNPNPHAASASDDSRVKKSKKTEKGTNPQSQLARRVDQKLAEGDIRGAVRAVSCDTGLAPFSAETFTLLKEKHPRQLEDHNSIEELLGEERMSESNFLTTSEDAVKKAVMSFPSGSSGGPDGLRPLHLKDLMSISAGDGGIRLTSSLTALINVILRGETCPAALPVLFGASLCALEKKTGGIRPIAVGNTIRRIAGKVISSHVMMEMGRKLRPVQLGYGTKSGCEAAIHSVRQFCEEHDAPKVILKGDYTNAFNSISRVAVLNKTKELVPSALPYALQAYKQPTTLFFGDFQLKSECGVQQGDPLGPLLFSIAIHELAASLQSELNVWYLDDVTVGGEPSVVLADLRKIQSVSQQIGLSLNNSKSEIIIIGGNRQQAESIASEFLDVAPGIKIVPLEEATLLGSPLVDEGIPAIIKEKTEALERVRKNLTDIGTHNSLYLLKNCFLLPKLLYTLRTVPTWKNPEMLRAFDELQRKILEETLNVDINEPRWRQASLPVKKGGLGIRKVEDLALPGYFSSLHSVRELSSILLPGEQTLDIGMSYQAAALWEVASGTTALPSEPEKQQSWDRAIAQQTYQSLIQGSNSVADQARLFAASGGYSGAWLEAIPISAVGTKLDNESVRIAVSLRLGSRVCVPHNCKCSAVVQSNGLHGLDCRKSAGRHARHSELNSVIHRTLTALNQPSLLEPVGMTREDGRRPDGMTLFPWYQGKPLVWDATCVSTLAASNVDLSQREPGAAASRAEEAKRLKYSDLSHDYHFVPLGFETMGHWGSSAVEFIRELGAKLAHATGEARSTAFLKQRLSTAIQRGNAAAVRGTVPDGQAMSEIFQLPFDD